MESARWNSPSRLIWALLRTSYLSPFDAFSSVHVHLFDKTMELRVCKGFCQPIGNDLGSWDVLEINPPSSHFVTDLVVLDVNVLCSSMVDWVVGKSDRALVIAFEGDGLFGRLGI